ncbi:OmpA family protein [Primorskyibacter sp. S187A]|uniref:OmpA family protein n=1 Tax=Primorskyibacter sp. S187A TaxID=3415130 RepID=UPI003C7A1074
MTLIRKPFLLLSAAVIALTACTHSGPIDTSNGPNENRNAKTGAAIGAAAGALAGLLTAGDDPDEKRRAAATGAVVGALGGAAIGNALDRQEEDLRRDLGETNATITNTGDRLIVTLPQDILFATDSTAVRSDLQRDLRAVAGNLQAYPNSTVQVIGHTDSDGDAGYNLDLSDRRASAVASVLIGAGVNPGRIQTIGRGEDQPVASNLTPEGKAQNRRVEIVILPNA